MKFIFSFTIVLVLLWGCKKQQAPDMQAQAPICFYNASYLLTQMIAANSGSHRAYIILDNSDSNYQPPVMGAATQDLPCFDSRSFNGTIYQVPDIGSNFSQLQPWIMYMQVAPGVHNLLLADTDVVDRRVVTTASFAAAAGDPQTLYFTDSLGAFRTLLTTDQQLAIQDSIRLRFIHLSPDAGGVSLLANKQRLFPDSAVFGAVSTYVSYPLAAAANVSLQARSTADTTQILARFLLSAQPGRSYTVLLSGYKGNVSFHGPKGSTVTANGNIVLSVNTSF
jgi:hypothetical protein